MTAVAALYNIAASGGVVGGVVAAAFFLVLIGVAFILFLALRRTLKMAFRLVVVGIILVIAVVGSVSLWYFAADGRKGPGPAPIAADQWPEMKIGTLVYHTTGDHCPPQEQAVGLFSF